jgi:hypothetical protein
MQILGLTVGLVKEALIKIAHRPDFMETQPRKTSSVDLLVY